SNGQPGNGRPCQVDVDRVSQPRVELHSLADLMRDGRAACQNRRDQWQMRMQFPRRHTPGTLKAIHELAEGYLFALSEAPRGFLPVPRIAGPEVKLQLSMVIEQQGVRKRAQEIRFALADPLASYRWVRQPS